MAITALRTITKAAITPVSLSEVKAHLRVTHSAEDAYIQSLIAAATDWAQTYTGRILVDTQVGLRIDCFPVHGDSAELKLDPTGKWFTPQRYARKLSINARDKSILLPGGLVSAVNDIDYIDADGAAQTLTGPTSAAPGTDYQEDLTDDEWCFIYPSRESDWPATQSGNVNSVLIDYQVGWVDASDIPESILAAIRFKVADLFSIRDSNDGKLSRAAENLLEPYVVPSF